MLRDSHVHAPPRRSLGIATLSALLALTPGIVEAQEASRPVVPVVMQGALRPPAVAPEDDPLVTDRPDATESAETVRPGRFQLEGGYTLVGVDDVRAHSLGEVLLRIGVANRLELRVGLNSFAWVRTPVGNYSGFSDTSVGFKYKLHEGGSSPGGPTLAVLAATTVPTGSDDFSSDAAEPSARLAAAWDFSDKVGLSANVGWDYLHDPASAERFSQMAASIALGYGLSHRWGAFLEYFGFYPTAGNGPSASFVDAGLTYLLGPDLQLDARAGYGLNGDDDDFFVGFGTTARW